MAFGATNDEVQIVIDLVTQQAVAATEEFKKGLIDGMREATKEADKVRSEEAS